MSKAAGLLLWLTISLLVGGCTLIPETTLEADSTLPIPQSKTAITPETRTPTLTPTAVAPTPVPVIQLHETDRIVFTIPNPEPFSGREGEARPDWLGWGAETFAVAPDGNFWIADTAASPHRLLLYNPQGELLAEIQLQDLVVYAYDMVVDRDSIWLLDLSSQQPRVVQLGLEGELLSSVDIDKQIMTFDGNFIYNGVDSLLLGEAGELLLHGINGYTELIDATGAVVTQPLDALSYYGHRYQTGKYDEATRRIPIYVDESPFEISPDFYIELPAFLGFNPDGSFALAGYVEGAEYQADFQVRYYHATGELLGTARQHPQTFYKDFNHHLAFGPDGSIYQLLSNPDYSVQIMRLGFRKELPELTVVPGPAPTLLTPLQPGESTSTDEGQARNALLAFFADLSAGRYSQGSAYFGGETPEYLRPQAADETDEAYWEYVCTFLWCLPIAEITQVEQVSEQEYVFHVVFISPEGARFEIGACCGGDPAATPPVWQFAYPVQKIDGDWKVMRAPLFTP